MVKGNVKEVEEGMFRRKRVNESRCCCGRKVADLKIYLFSATKQDRAGPSLQSRNTVFTLGPQQDQGKGFSFRNIYCTIKL